MEIFNRYSEYYDLFYEDKDYQGESAYLDQLIQKCSPGAKTILDLGCGTGEHDVLLAQRNYTITGVDQSEIMLSIAREKLSRFPAAISNSLSFQHTDIRKLRLGKIFDVVISMFHVISYQQTNEDLKCAFTTAYEHLKPGGIFIFDCWYGPGVLEDPPTKRIKKVENDSIIVTRTAKPLFFRHENQVEVNYHLRIQDKTTDHTEEILETHRMRYLFKPEIELLLELCKMKLIYFSEMMKGTPPEHGQWNACFIGEK